MSIQHFEGLQAPRICPTVRPAEVGATLRGAHRAEVCVIGAGYAGLSTAYHLAERGYDTVVVEASRIGAGASGRNGGQVLPGFAAEPQAMIDAMGEERARALWLLSLHGVAKVRALAGSGCDLSEGVAMLAAHPADLAMLDKTIALRRGLFGDRLVDKLDAEGMSRHVATSRQYGGAVDRRAFALDPAKYALALAQHALRAGARIHEASAATRIVRDAAGWRIDTAAGSVHAADVVLAANVDIPGLEPSTRRLASPIRTFMLETVPLARDDQPLRGVAAAYDTSATLHYFRKTADGRLQFGAGGWPSRTTPPFARRLLRRELGRLFPALRGVEIAREWSGLVDATTDGLPRFASSDGLTRLLGFCGHGVALTTIAGQLASDAIDGDDTGFRALACIAQGTTWPSIPGRAIQLAFRRLALPLARRCGFRTA
jgi:gamma-glutamylputrescine oxidase